MDLRSRDILPASDAMVDIRETDNDDLAFSGSLSNFKFLPTSDARLAEPITEAEFSAEIETEPVAALDRFFAGGFVSFPSSIFALDSLLLSWCKKCEGVSALDDAFAAWIRVKRNNLTVSDADGWKAICSVIEKTSLFSKSEQELFARDQFARVEPALVSITTSRSSDCMGAFLSALATKNDSSLTRFWLKVANVPPGYSWFHGRFGVVGLYRLMEIASSKEAAMKMLGNALWRFAQALLRMCDAEGLSLPHRGKAEWTTTAAMAVPAHLIDQAWHQASEPFLSWQRWFLDKASQTSKASTMPAAASLRGVALGLEANAAAMNLTTAWKLPDYRASLDRVILILDELRSEAMEIGHNVWLVKTLCSASRAALLNGKASECETWAKEALEKAPWNPHAWEKLAHAKLLKKDYESALELGWSAFGLFPMEPRAWILLGMLFNYCKRSDELGFLRRAAAERFGSQTSDLAAMEFPSLSKASSVVRPSIDRIRSDEARSAELDFLLRMKGLARQNLANRMKVFETHISELSAEKTFVSKQELRLDRNELSLEEASQEAAKQLRLTPHAYEIAIHLTTLRSQTALEQKWSWQEKAQDVLSGLDHLSNQQRSYPLLPLAEAFGCLATLDGRERTSYAAERLEHLWNDGFGLSEMAIMTDCTPVNDNQANDIKRRMVVGAVKLSLSTLLPTPKSEELEEISGEKLVNRFDRKVTRLVRDAVWPICSRILKDLASELSPNVGAELAAVS